MKSFQFGHAEGAKSGRNLRRLLAFLAGFVKQLLVSHMSAGGGEYDK